MKMYNFKRSTELRKEPPDDFVRIREEAKGSLNVYDFLDSPEDPYFLPSDTETVPAKAKPAVGRKGPRSDAVRQKPALPTAQQAAVSGGTLTGSAPGEKQPPARGFSRATLLSRAGAPAKQAGTSASSQKLADLSSNSQPSGERPHLVGRKRKQPTCSPAISEALAQIVIKTAEPAPGRTQQQHAKGEAAATVHQKDRQLRAQRTNHSKTRAKSGTTVHRPSRLAKATMPEDAPALTGPVPGPCEQKGVPSLPQLQQAAKAPATAKLAEVNNPQNGLRTPLLLRNALTAGLARVLSGPAFSMPAPAVTVMEAQETGEQMELQDSVLYALDGLYSTSSLTTHRESAATLAEVCATRRGRLALKAEGVFVEAMSAGQRLLSKQWDPEVALAFAVMLLYITKEPVNQDVLVCKEAAQLLRLCIQSAKEGEAAVAEEGGAGSSAPRILRLLREGALAKSLPQVEAASPAAVAVLTIIGATDPQHTTSATESFKAALRKHGVLDALAELVATQLKASSERSAWLLHKSLVSLENSSFACTENEAYLVNLRLPTTAGPSGIAAALVHLVQRLVEESAHASSSERASHAECLHCSLSVIMNITHNNDDGCRQVLHAGGLEAAARLLSDIMLESSGQGRQQLLASVDIVSVALGMLINVAEKCPKKMQPLIDANLPGQQRFLPLLCRLMEEAMPEAGRSSPEAEQDSSEVEVTVENLIQHEEDSRASIVEVYSALLIGFLVAPRRDVRVEVTATLACGSLEPVIAGVQRCLKFYLDAGAITERTEKSLRNLLRLLSEP